MPNFRFFKKEDDDETEKALKRVALKEPLLEKPKVEAKTNAKPQESSKVNRPPTKHDVDDQVMQHFGIERPGYNGP